MIELADTAGSLRDHSRPTRRELEAWHRALRAQWAALHADLTPSRDLSTPSQRATTARIADLIHERQTPYAVREVSQAQLTELLRRVARLQPAWSDCGPA